MGKKYEGVRGHMLQVEADELGEDEKGKKGKGSGKEGKKGNYVPRPGDWSCPKCKVWNFARYTECRSCRFVNPKAASMPGSSSGTASNTLASQLWEQKRAQGRSRS